ncbi:hypothetical protein ACJX0J_027703, partial [Zea mays]
MITLYYFLRICCQIHFISRFSLHNPIESLTQNFRLIISHNLDLYDDIYANKDYFKPTFDTNSKSLIHITNFKSLIHIDIREVENMAFIIMDNHFHEIIMALLMQLLWIKNSGNELMELKKYTLFEKKKPRTLYSICICCCTNPNRKKLSALTILYRYREPQNLMKLFSKTDMTSSITTPKQDLT